VSDSDKRSAFIFFRRVAFSFCCVLARAELRTPLHRVMQHFETLRFGMLHYALCEALMRLAGNTLGGLPNL
jgi:hypothetical protein